MFLRTQTIIIYKRFYETWRRVAKQLFRIETISVWILFSNTNYDNINIIYIINIIIVLKCTHSFPFERRAGA